MIATFFFFIFIGGLNIGINWDEIVSHQISWPRLSGCILPIAVAIFALILSASELD